MREQISDTTLDFLTAPRVERSYLILCLVLLPLAAFFAFVRPWEPTADVWETAAAMRAVAENFTQPHNPLLDLPGDTSPQFTPYTLLWGAVMGWWGVSVLTVMGIAGMLNFLLFVTGIFRFAGRVGRSGLLPVYLLLTMLVVWGTGYDVAGGYQLRLFLETLPHTVVFAYALAFHALAYLRKFVDMYRVHDLAGYVLLAMVVLATDPLTGLFVFLTAGAMAAEERNWRQFALLQAVPLAAAGAAVFWPYFDYWRVLTRLADGPENPLFYRQVEALGPALAGIPIAVYYAFKRRYGMAVVGLSLCLFVYAGSYVAQVEAGGRFVFYSAFFLHLAIAVYLYEHGVHRRRFVEAWLSSHGYLIIIVFMVFLPGIWHRGQDMYTHLERVYDPPLNVHAYASPAAPFYFLADELNETDIVLADDTTGWVLPALTGAKIVSQFKDNPLMAAEVAVRRQGVHSFLYGGISTRERVAIIRRYRVTHILLDARGEGGWSESFLRDLELVATPQKNAEGLRLYRVTI